MSFLQTNLLDLQIVNYYLLGLTMQFWFGSRINNNKTSFVQRHKLEKPLSLYGISRYSPARGFLFLGSPLTSASGCLIRGADRLLGYTKEMCLRQKPLKNAPYLSWSERYGTPLRPALHPGRRSCIFRYVIIFSNINYYHYVSGQLNSISVTLCGFIVKD